jgi:plasmid stabilization system protein ParE
MDYKMILQKDFVKKSAQIAVWIETKWSKQSADKFVNILYEKLNEVNHNPFIGQSCKNNNTRKILITPHNKLFYRVKGKTIYIITLFDTRQNPKKNKYE